MQGKSQETNSENPNKMAPDNKIHRGLSNIVDKIIGQGGEGKKESKIRARIHGDYHKLRGYYYENRGEMDHAKADFKRAEAHYKNLSESSQERRN